MLLINMVGAETQGVHYIGLVFFVFEYTFLVKFGVFWGTAGCMVEACL